MAWIPYCGSEVLFKIYFYPDLFAAEGSKSILPSSLVQRLKNIRAQGTKWLWSQKTEAYGWPSGDSPRAVVTLALALDDWPAKDDLEARLVVKQLEIELLEKLLRLDTFF